MAIRFIEEELLAGSPYRELPKEQLDSLKQKGTPPPANFREQYLKDLPVKKAEADFIPAGEVYEDVAGLKPLPVSRMRKQSQGGGNLSKSKVQSTIDGFDPLENQFQQMENNENPNKRSRTVDTPYSAVAKIGRDVLKEGEFQRKRTFNNSADQSIYSENTVEEYQRRSDNEQRDQKSADPLDFVSTEKLDMLRNVVFDYLSQQKEPKESDIPVPNAAAKARLWREYQAWKGDQFLKNNLDFVNQIVPIDTPSNPNPEPMFPGV